MQLTINSYNPNLYRHKKTPINQSSKLIKNQISLT